MAKHQSDPLFLHPVLHAALPGIKATVKASLPVGWDVRTGSQAIHRTPNEQFELFKKGRKFVNGTWKKVDKSQVVTGKDGFKNKSRHNYLPASAVDIVLFKPNGEELKAGVQENKIGLGAAAHNLEWGGDFKGDFQDLPHIQIPLSRLYKKNLEMDEALQWQKYLFHGKALTRPEDLDGLWGKVSTDALEVLTGVRERTPAAWESLFKKFGPLEGLADFKVFPWVPSVS